MANLYADFQDHIALELEYMSHLYSRIAVALEHDDTDGARNALEAKDLFVKRLAKWLPRLEARLHGKSETGFYEAALQLVQVLTRLEALDS